MVTLEQSRRIDSLLEKVEDLSEPEEDDDVDDGEREHVSGDHAEDHRHERAGQLDRTAKWH